MLYVLYALFFISCIVLVASVLLQPGKTDAGALFTSNVSSAAFGPRGTASVLSKITIAAATVFMVSALLISMPALSGNVSVLQSQSETGTSESNAVDASIQTVEGDTNAADANAAPAVITEAPANTGAPANTAAPANN